MNAAKSVSLAIFLVAVLLRIFHLGNQQLWLDETISFHIATVPTGLAKVLSMENSPPLYYLLLRLWLPVAGVSETAVRFPSAVAGALGVLAIMWAGWQIFGPAVGLWAGLFAALAPIHVYYSQEARTYAFLTLELALTYGLLWRAMRRNTWTAWVLASVAALAALYSHYLSIIGLLPTVIVLWAWPQDAESPRRLRRFLAATFLCAALYIPWLLWAFLFTPRADVVDPSSFWADLWMATPPSMAIPRTLEVFALGPQRDLVVIHMKQFASLRLPNPMRWFGIAVLLGLALWVALPWKDDGLKIPWLGRRKVCVASLLGMPLIFLWLVSLSRPIYVPGRYDQVAFVGYALLVGLALAKLQSVTRWGRTLAVLVAVALFTPIGTKLLLYYKAPPEREAEATARAVHLLVQNGDVVVLNAVRGIPILNYYLPRLDYEWKNGMCRSNRQHREFSCRLYPPEMEEIFLPPALRAPEKVRADVAAFLSPVEATNGRLWVVLFDGRIANGLLGSSRSEDLLLVGELVRVGFQPESVHFSDVPAMYLFRRYAPGIALPRAG